LPRQGRHQGCRRGRRGRRGRPPSGPPRQTAAREQSRRWRLCLRARAPVVGRQLQRPSDGDQPVEQGAPDHTASASRGRSAPRTRLRPAGPATISTCAQSRDTTPLSRVASGIQHLFEPLFRVHLLVRVAVWMPPPVVHRQVHQQLGLTLAGIAQAQGSGASWFLRAGAQGCFSVGLLYSAIIGVLSYVQHFVVLCVPNGCRAAQQAGASEQGQQRPQDH